MRVPPGARAAELLALYQSGELARHVAAAGSMLGVAKAIGWTPDMLKGAWDGLKRAGKMPGWSQMAHSEIAHQVAANPAGDIRSETPIPSAGTPMPEVGTRWPSVAAFDAGDIAPVVPRGHILRGVSSLIDGETGAVKQQWVKTVEDDTGYDPVEVIRMAFADGVPLLNRIEPPQYSNGDLLAVYGLGDPHIGMLAWEAECGENFDLAIAERHIVEAADQLVAVAPAARDALVISVGDTLHSDGQRNSTTKGTPVDVDGRTPKMIATTIRTFRRVITRALAKHENVYVKLARGNHDEMMSVVVAIALGQHYENNPRVHVDTSPAFFHYHRFGDNFIVLTHGHRQKPIEIMAHVAASQSKDWGETTHRRGYCGHYHHEMTKEVPGLVIDYLPTLAAKEAYAAAHGYVSNRSMRCDVLHRTDGLVNRHVVGIQQIVRAVG